ncbi:MAG TPA: alpha/beta hydrolase, partial [Ktedonobacteraceae bacterium]
MTQTGYAEVNGTTLYYEVAGEGGKGHPLVLLHGGLVDSGLWDDQFGVFARHYKVVRYDMRGYGKSGLLKTDTGAYSLREDLYALLQFLGIEKTYLIGLSMGGGLAIDFTLEHAEMVDALITVGASVSGFESEDTSNSLEAEADEAFKQRDIARAVEITLRIWTDGPERSPEEVDAGVRERVRVMTTHNFSRPDDEDAPEPLELVPPAISRLSEMHVPTLVVVGDKDVRDILTIADVLEK